MCGSASTALCCCALAALASIYVSICSGAGWPSLLPWPPLYVLPFLPSLSSFSLVLSLLYSILPFAELLSVSLLRFSVLYKALMLRLLLLLVVALLFTVCSSIQIGRVRTTVRSVCVLCISLLPSVVRSLCGFPLGRLQGCDLCVSSIETYHDAVAVMGGCCRRGLRRDLQL